MSVRGQFGYQNIIPQTGDFTFVVAMKADGATSGQSAPRVMFIEKDGSSWLNISRTGSQLELRTSSGVTVSFDVYPSSFDYIIFEFRTASNSLRLWNPVTTTFTDTIIGSFDLQFGVPNITWLHGLIGTLGSPAPLTGGVSKHIHYFAILDTTVDADFVDVVNKGVQPFEWGNKLKNIIFLRDYSLGTSVDNNYSIGVATIVGTPSTNAGIGTISQFGATGFVNQDRGIRIGFNDELTFPFSLWKMKNGEIVFSQSVILQQTDFRLTFEYNIDIAHEITASDTFSLIDKYISIGNSLTFTQDVIVALEKTMEIANSITFQQDIKLFDGVISHSLTFQTEILNSIKLLTISNDVEFEETDIQSNYKIEHIEYTCWLTGEINLAEFENQTSDNDCQTFTIVEEITCSKEVTRSETHELTMHVECLCYKVSLADQVDYGG